MPLLHRFGGKDGDDMLVVRDLGQGLWSLVAREVVRVGGSPTVAKYVQIDFTEDEIIEFAEKILGLATQHKSADDNDRQGDGVS